jgi:hypothetical protein
MIPGQTYYTVPWALNTFEGKLYIDVDYACFESETGNFKLAIKLDGDTIIYDDKKCKNKDHGDKQFFSKMLAVKGDLILL